MVALEIVQSCNAKLVQSQPLVAVIVGGTAGIGECTVRAIAATHANHGKGLRLYIVGRNKDAADKTISSCRDVCPTGQFRFVRAEDLSLLEDVDRCCAEIIQAEKQASETGEEAKVDLLVETQGYLTFEARKETKEGLDTLMSLVYYSRMRFVTKLLPLLLASPLSGRVLSVFNPKLEGKVLPDDLSLRDPKHYGFTYTGSHIVQMTTFFMENIAKRNPGRIALGHVYPGIVMTDAIDKGRLPTWVRYLWRYAMGPILRPFAIPFMETGERMLFITSSRFPARPLNSTVGISKSGGEVEIAMSSDGIVGGGAYRINSNGETLPTGKAYEEARKAGMYEKIWDHTMKAFEVIEAGDVFKE